MSRYTTQLRWIIDMALISNHIKTDSSAVSDKCSAASPYIFNFNFPIWAEADRSQFEKDFLMHFYFNEIGAETVGQWKVFLEDWLNTNMPMWNVRMNTVIMNNADQVFKENWTETFDGSGTGKNMQKYYEVPNSSIQDIADHLNNATSNEGENTNNHSIVRTPNNRVDDMIKILNDVQNVKNEMFKAMDVLFMGVY